VTPFELALFCAVLFLILVVITLATIALDLRAQRDQARETLGHIGVRSFRVAPGTEIRMGDMVILDQRGLIRDSARSAGPVN
jgi:hypothetical protein